MTQKELIPIIKKNLSNISVGQRFSTETKLYKELQIPFEPNSIKTVKKAVLLFIKWEISRPESNSKEIIITQIIESPEYTDNRKGNGGAHNVKYTPIVKPALLHYNYGEFITYKQIDTDIYGFNPKYIEPNDYEHDKVRQYKDYLYAQLKSITDSSLDSLMKEGLLTYKKVLVINNGAVFDKKIEMIPGETLLELYARLYGGSLAQLQLNELEKMLNQVVDSLNSDEKKADEKNSKTIEPFCLSKISLMEFLDRVSRNMQFKDMLKKTLINQDKIKKSQIASENQIYTIREVEETICRHLGFEHYQMNFDRKKQKSVYSRANVFYWILGWSHAYKALTITVFDKRKAIEEYPISNFSHDKLLQQMESQVIHWVIDKNKYNPYEEEKKKLQKQRRFGRKRDIILAENKDLFPLAEDQEVNILHCKVFNLSDDINYFKKLLPDEE